MSDSDTYAAVQQGRTVRHEIRGVDYTVTEWGDSKHPLIVYLHGWGDTGSSFQFVVDALRRNWFVVAPDWRGFGASVVDASAFWFPDYLADLDQLLARYSPEEPVRLIGHSMGGNVAGLYSGAMPERVSRFINLEGFGLADSDAADAPARYAEWLQRGQTALPQSERESFTVLAEAIRRRSPRMTLPQAEFVARLWATEEPDGRVRVRINPAHKLPNPVLYRRAEAEACWRNVTAEVLLVAGRQSSLATLDNLPFPRQQTVWIEDAGHMLHFEKAAALAEVIEEFLTKPST